MMVWSQNLIDEVRAILMDISSRDPRIVSSYLYGSVLRTDFFAEESDVDILVTVTDSADAKSFIQISTAIREQIPNAEVTMLRLDEIEAGIHPGWSRHFFRNVVRSGVHLQGPDCLATITAEPLKLDEAYRRLVQLCQRARLVVSNPSKAHEANFWLRKYQHWIPLCLMELLDLHGTPEDRLHWAHTTFMKHFPDASHLISYPYRKLEELHLFLEGLVTWIPSNTGQFSAEIVIAPEHPYSHFCINTLQQDAVALPLIGVVTAFGRPEYDLLKLAAQSLIDLSRFNSANRVGFEWVVCIDGQGVSETVVQEIVSRVTQRCVVVTNHGNHGPGPARNMALQHISAPWLLTLDGDDTIRPGGIAALLEALQRHPGASWAAGRCHHVDRNGEFLWEGPEDYFAAGRVESGCSFWEAKLANGGIPFICNATLASTAAVRAVGGWPATGWGRAEDTALWAVLTRLYWGIWVPEVVYDYRRHPASMTRQPGFRGLDEHLDEIAAMVQAGCTNNTCQEQSPAGTGRVIAMEQSSRGEEN